MNSRQTTAILGVIAMVLVFVIALFAVTCQAAAPTPAPRIDVKPTYELYEPIVVSVDQGATFRFWDYPDTLRVIEQDDGHTLHIWAPSGTYRLKCDLFTIDWEARTGTQARLRADFIVGEPEPPVPPEPPPPPIPPLDRKYQVGFFHSNKLENLPRGQQTILGSLSLREELKKRGHALLGVYDEDCTGPEGIPERLKPWWKAIEGDPLPRIAIAPLKGGEITDYPLPADPAALWKLLEGK